MHSLRRPKSLQPTLRLHKEIDHCGTGAHKTSAPDELATWIRAHPGANIRRLGDSLVNRLDHYLSTLLVFRPHVNRLNQRSTTPARCRMLKGRTAMPKLQPDQSLQRLSRCGRLRQRDLAPLPLTRCTDIVGRDQLCGFHPPRQTPMRLVTRSPRNQLPPSVHLVHEAVSCSFNLFLSFQFVCISRKGSRLGRESPDAANMLLVACKWPSMSVRASGIHRKPCMSSLILS